MSALAIMDRLPVLAPCSTRQRTAPFRSRPLLACRPRATMAAWADHRRRAPPVPLAWCHGGAVRASVCGMPAGVTLLSAPPGSGKTVLLRSWIDGRSPRPDGLDPGGPPGARPPALLAVGRRGVAVRGRCGWTRAEARADARLRRDGLVRRLISDLDALDEPVVLVIDDLHELVSPEALAQLELLLTRRPPMLYVVLATRHDPSLGLHRLRLAGELTELRAVDFRFSAEEARSSWTLPGSSCRPTPLGMLQARTEGWAAGLRLATMSLAGRPDPERFVAEFSGSDRTVADYLLAEVLEHQPEPGQAAPAAHVRPRAGQRADRGPPDGRDRLRADPAAARRRQRVRRLARPGADLVPLPLLFADLLRLELRRSEPDSVPRLHHEAAEWYAEHGLRARRHQACAGGERLAVRRPTCGAVRLQPGAGRQLRDDPGAPRALPSGGVGESRTGRAPRLWRGDPAFARHRRRYIALAERRRRRCPTNDGSPSTDACDRADDPRPLARRLRRLERGPAAPRARRRRDGGRSRGWQDVRAVGPHDSRHRRVVVWRRRRRRTAPHRRPSSLRGATVGCSWRWAASATSP